MNWEFVGESNRLANRSKDLLHQQRELGCIDARYLDEANAAIQSARDADAKGDLETAWGEIDHAESCLFWVRHDLDVCIRLLAEVGKVFNLSSELSEA
jgi:hypothetical protein